MRTLGGKRGVMFFTVDALIAGVILILTVVLLFSFLLNEPQSIDVTYYSTSYVDYITNTKMSQFNSAYSFIYYDPNELNPNLFVYEKIFLMKSTGAYSDTTIASFVDNFTSVVIPEHVGVEYKIDNNVIYLRHEDRRSNADILLSTSVFTFVEDENKVIYGPSVTKITVWV
jgi:hypothetical protein